MAQNYFKETQGIRKWWIWVPALILLLFFGYALTQQLLFNNPIGDQPMTDTGLILVSILTFLVFAGFLSLRLHTFISNREIKLRLSFLWKGHYTWKEVKSAEIIHYGWAGYGLRLSKKHGTLLSMGSNYGLQLQLHNGDTVTVGTQRKKELEKFLSSNPNAPSIH